MKWTKTLLLLTVATISYITSSQVSASDNQTYFCVSEAAGGLMFNPTLKAWTGTNFKPQTKWLVKIESGFAKVKQFDDSDYISCGKLSEYGVVSCNIFFGGFIFNNKTLRFQSTYLIGYVGGEDSNDNTPHIEAGSCSVM